MKKLFGLAFVAVLPAILQGVSFGQQSDITPQEADAAAAKNTEFMNRTIRSYRFYAFDEKGGKRALEFHDGNLIAWTNPVSGVRPGGLYLWTREGRPAAIVKMFYNANSKRWFQQMQSLARDRISAEQEDGTTIWRPQGPGIEMVPAAGAPAPGDSPVVRLRQMRQMIEQFAVYDNFQEGSEWGLRPLPKAIYRYGGPPADVVDGAIFAFVQGTNPEAIVLFEARPLGKNGGSAWHCAVARLTGYPARATYQSRPIWSVPLRYVHQTKPEDACFARMFR